MIKKAFLLLLTLAVLASSISASPETDWLLQKSDKGKFPTLEENSLALLAFNKELASTSPLSSALIDLKNELSTCLASNSCNTKNTAMAIWALKEIGDPSETLDLATTWLINSRTMFASDISGEWLIQIISPVSGQCILINDEIPKNQTLLVNSGFTPWISVSADMITQTTNSLKIDCSSLSTLSSQNLILSLINKKTVSGMLNYFIKEESQNQKITDIQLGIPCWGSTYRSTCNPETTAYVLLALNKLGKNPDPAWLESQSLTPFQTAVLYDLTQSQARLTALESTQTPNGYWSPLSTLTTSLIYSLLPANSPSAEKAASWLLSQKADAACWPRPSNLCTVQSTSAAVYALGAQAATTPPASTPAPDRTELIDCDQRCENSAGCICPSACTDSQVDSGDTCGGEKISPPTGPELGDPCITFEACEGTKDAFGRCLDISGDGCPEDDTDTGISACDNNGICGTSEDCSCQDCEDKPCYTPAGTGICNFYTEECETEESGVTGAGAGTASASDQEKEKEEKSRALFWFLMLLALLIAAGGGIFLAYKKGLIKFKKTGGGAGPAAYTPRISLSKKPEHYRPRTRSRHKKSPVKNFLDKELDKSMQELEKLLKK